MKQEVYEAAVYDRLIDYIIEYFEDDDTIDVDNPLWKEERDNFKIYKNKVLKISVEDGYVNDMPNDYYVESPMALMQLTSILYELR